MSSAEADRSALGEFVEQTTHRVATDWTRRRPAVRRRSDRRSRHLVQSHVHSRHRLAIQFGRPRISVRAHHGWFGSSSAGEDQKLSFRLLQTWTLAKAVDFLNNEIKEPQLSHSRQHIYF